MPFDLNPIVFVAMLVFVAVSVVVGSLLATAGGWGKAASRFRAPAGPLDESERFRFTSVVMTGGWLGVARYQGCVTIGLSERGISLALWAPFRLFHPPLLIPWSAVEDCKPRLTLGPPGAQILLRGGGGFQLYGRAAAALSSRWRDRVGVVA
jgi:hypothetical protein